MAARRYARDNKGRFAPAGQGATARGGRLRTAAGNKRATQTKEINKSKPSNTVAKPKNLKADKNAMVKIETNQRLRARAAARASEMTAKPSDSNATTAKPTTQKQRWAARSAKLSEAAAKNEAKAKRMFEAANTAGNTAFNTQSGRIPGRARMNAQTERSFQLQEKAAQQRSRAANLERMATTNKGDAAKARTQKAEAIKASHKGLKKGDTIEGTLYGVREVVKVNAKSVTVKGGIKNFTIPWEFIKPKT